MMSVEFDENSKLRLLPSDNQQNAETIKEEIQILKDSLLILKIE